MKKVIIHSKGLDRVKKGHPWIYRSQIKEIQASVEAGEAVAVYTDRKKWIGIGWTSPHSEIFIRVLTRRDEAIDRDFFKRRFLQAISWRKTRCGSPNALRWINAESDNLPGLILDEYRNYFVIQTTTVGMELEKPTLVQIIRELFNPEGIYERNDFPARGLEKLPSLKGSLYGKNPPDLLEIEENKTRFLVDMANGHKTGFYLDQRENRARAAVLAQSKEVLDCFSYTGGFAVSSLVHGAKSVLAVDSSPEVLNLARKNAALNGVEDRWQDQCGNGFDLLKSLSSEGRTFDLVILDPPSFTRKKDALERARSGYKEINLRAMKMIRDGGILVSASCSHHMTEALFQEILVEAAADSRKRLIQIHRGTQAPDHPILPAIPETHYLKCHFYEVRTL